MNVSNAVGHSFLKPENLLRLSVGDVSACVRVGLSVSVSCQQVMSKHALENSLVIQLTEINFDFSFENFFP